MKKFLLLLAAFFCAAGLMAQEFIPLKLSPEWSYYHNPVEKYDDWDPSAVTAVTETLGTAKREIVKLKPNGCFLHHNKPGWTTGVLVNEFESDRAGNMLLHCGASAFRMKIAINGKMLFESRLSSSGGCFGKRGSHDLVLPVQKGKNVLAISFLGAEFAVNEGNPEIYKATLPTREHFKSIRYSAFGSRARVLEQVILRNGVDQITIPIFKKLAHHPELSAEETEKIYQEYPVLEFYDKALDKIL
ncbi:MAG: hypothetical protein J6R85_01725 [Lentisphaeria bacterium]|nr:hypothetical protein [Lentisphaeria bacterium]